MPFVQGQLREETLSFLIETECGHCHRPLHIEIDSALRYSVQEEDAVPVLSAPLIDLRRLDEPNIIDSF